LFEIPNWIQAARLLLTFLFTSAAGVHAYALFQDAQVARRRADLPDVHSGLGESLQTPLRWGFFLYSVLFLFTSVLNFIYLLIMVAMRGYGGAPFKLGTLSLILVASYVTVVFGSGRQIEK